MSVLNPQHDRCFLLEFLQLCGDETVGPRRQFFYDCHISETEYANHVIETEHTNASTCVIYVFLFIVFVIFVFVAKSAYNTKKDLKRLQVHDRLKQETRNPPHDQVQPATNAHDNQAMQHE